MSPSRHRLLVAGALLAVVTLLPACRCDGGFGRKWRGASWDWTAARVGAHACDDRANFAAHLCNAADFLTPDFDKSGREISRTVNLYTTGKAQPCWCHGQSD